MILQEAAPELIDANAPLEAAASNRRSYRDCKIDVTLAPRTPTLPRRQTFRLGEAAFALDRALDTMIDQLLNNSRPPR